MKLCRIVGIAVTAAVLLSPCMAVRAAKPDTLYYEVKMHCPRGDMGVRKMYMRGSDFLWEADSAGVSAKIVKNKDGAFLINSLRKVAAKYPPGSTRESPMAMLPGPTGDVKSFLSENSAKKTGEETVGKKRCEVYAYKEKTTKWGCKLWVDKKTVTPVKMVMAGEKPADTVTVTYVKYSRGLSIPDSKFQVPKGMKVVSMPGGSNPAASTPFGK